MVYGRGFDSRRLHQISVLGRPKPSLTYGSEADLLSTRRRNLSERSAGPSKVEAKGRRDELGRFKPGRSGNPEGRPRDLERRRRFIAAYLANCGWRSSSTRSWLPEPGVRVTAYRLMRDPDVRAAIDAEWRARL